MLEILLELANVIMTFAAWVAVMFFASRRHPIAPRSFWGIMAAATVLQCAGFFLYRAFWGTSIPALNLYIVLMAGFRAALLFWIYRRQVFQNLFYLFSIMLIMTVVQGGGNLIELELQNGSPLAGRVYNRLTELVLLFVTLPAMIYVMRRLQRYLRAQQDDAIWRRLWVIPFCLFFLAVFASPTQIGGLSMPGMYTKVWMTMLTRGIMLLALWINLYLVGDVMRIAGEAERARLRAEKAERNLALREKVIAGIPSENLVTCGPLVLDTGKGRAFLGQEDLMLGPKEFLLLLHCIRHEGKTLSRESVYEAVWKQPLTDRDATLKSSISRLRRKIEDSGYRILAVRGQGYIFEKDQNTA